jgi:hypothetical protein
LKREIVKTLRADDLDAQAKGFDSKLGGIGSAHI